MSVPAACAGDFVFDHSELVAVLVDGVESFFGSDLLGYFGHGLPAIVVEILCYTYGFGKSFGPGQATISEGYEDVGGDVVFEGKAEFVSGAGGCLPGWE